MIESTSPSLLFLAIAFGASFIAAIIMPVVVGLGTRRVRLPLWSNRVEEASQDGHD
ncbi:MAG TPA: hypothetical protein VE397_06545 [Stellaceae bacterium]|nr:hypothetical protein [Stellaceae bacterium]